MNSVVQGKRETTNEFWIHSLIAVILKHLMVEILTEIATGGVKALKKQPIQSVIKYLSRPSLQT